MKYMLLIYDREAMWTEMGEDERNALYGEYMTFTDEIRKSGHMVDGAPLEPTATATTVRIRGGRLATTDGPYAETKEQLGGYYIIEAAHLDEAIAIAGRVPSARLGSIEIRPIASME